MKKNFTNIYICLKIFFLDLLDKLINNINKNEINLNLLFMDTKYIFRINKFNFEHLHSLRKK